MINMFCIPGIRHIRGICHIRHSGVRHFNSYLNSLTQISIVNCNYLISWRIFVVYLLQRCLDRS